MKIILDMDNVWLSKEDVLKGREISGDNTWGEDYLVAIEKSFGRCKKEIVLEVNNTTRTNKVLIALIENKIIEEDGYGARIVEIPDGAIYAIEFSDYSGMEYVVLLHEYIKATTWHVADSKLNQ